MRTMALALAALAALSSSDILNQFSEEKAPNKHNRQTASQSEGVRYVV